MQTEQSNHNDLHNSSDGWNPDNDAIDAFITFSHDVDKLAYEFSSSRRGAYALESEDPENIVEFLEELKIQLKYISSLFENYV